MGAFAVTGSASGMGAAVARRLRSDGYRVVGVDRHDAEVCVDLATAEGRAAAVTQVLERVDGRLDGAVTAAGLASARDVDRRAAISAVNYLGTVELLEAWRPALAASGGAAKVVAFSSNAATTAPVPAELIEAVMSGDTEGVLARSHDAGPHASGLVYAATKVAISRWVRRRAVSPEWAGAGIRLNAIAPGVVLTPMVREQLGEDDLETRVRAFPLPVGELGDPDQLAAWVLMMLSPAAAFLCGSVIVVDGGTEAWFRGEEWPAPIPVAERQRFADRIAEFRERA